MVTPTEQLAWLGGYFEGEGSWHWDGHKIGARVTSCDKDNVVRFRKYARVGSVYGPIPPSGFGKKPRWMWNIGNTTDSYAFYLGVKPYLSERRNSRFQQFLALWYKNRKPRRKLTKDDEWNIRQAKARIELPGLRRRLGVIPCRVSQIRRKKWSAYVAGKMRDLPGYGFALFDEARDVLLDKGWTVVSPADLDREANEDPNSNLHSFHLIAALKRDFDTVKRLDSIVLLPNWKTSEGAKAEKLVAERMSRKIFCYGSKIGDIYDYAGPPEIT